MSKITDKLDVALEKLRKRGATGINFTICDPPVDHDLIAAGMLKHLEAMDTMEPSEKNDPANMIL